MTHNKLLIAGFGTLALSTIALWWLVSAANTDTAISSTTSVASQTRIHMKWGKAKFWPHIDFGGDRRGKGMMGIFWGEENSAITAALKANDYKTFVTAWNADTNKPSDATVPTETQFNTMVIKYKKHIAIQTALENNDYNAYVKATTPTQEEFNQQVSEYKTRSAMKTAIQNKDYKAFVAAWNADTNKPSDATVPTETQFNKMITKKEEKSKNTTTQQ